MRKKLYLGFCALVLLTLSSFAQTVTVTGKVTDGKEGKPLPGVTVKVKGKSVGTLTAPDGTFKINVQPTDKTLEVSSIGFVSLQVKISSTPLAIQLIEAGNNLSEVVVVGFGTKVKRDITGSQTTISGKDIANTPATSFESAIQGKAAGVLVTQQNGKLGQGINIRIRGASSVTAGNEPLYVVDGIPITTNNLSSTSAPTNALADLNMNDIESMEILKDASAAAIYGSRASNGVVLITTKKGKIGNSKIEFGYYTGTQKPTGKREFMNAQQYVDYFAQAGKGAAHQDFLAGAYATEAAAQAAYVTTVATRMTRYSAGNNDWQTAKVNTDWQAQVLRDAPISQYDLNISGGNEKTRYFISGQYLDQTGILIANSYKRYSGRVNIDNQVRNWLTVGLNMNYSKSTNYRVSNDNAFSTPLQIIALSPITPLIDPRTGLTSGALDPATGRPNTNFPVYYNPMLSVQNAFYNTYVNRTIGNVYASATITKGLTFRSEFGLDQLNQLEENYYGKLTARNTGVPNGSGSLLTSTVFNTNTNNFFNYRKTFASVHDIDFLLGMSYQSKQSDFSTASAEQFPSDAYQKLTSAASKTNASSSSTTNTLLSYFSKVNYKYNDKYLLSLSGRIDGSSRFGSNNRYGFFPAASAGWLLNKESFMENIMWISFLKLKASYGKTGNDNIGDFASRGLYTGTGGAYGGQAGQIPSQIPNPDLKWESTLGSDVGIEASFFKNRVSIEVDYYNRDTKDLLLNKDVPGTTGFSSQLRNVGSLNNKGIELTVNTTNVSTKSFRWTTSLNFAANQNKITNLDGQLLGTGVNKAKEGQPLGVFYAREFAGADPANGDGLYYKNTPKSDGTLDRTTTNSYNSAVDVRIGSPIPKFIYGFSNTFSYKSITLDVLLQGVSGNDVYNGGGQYMSASGSNGYDNQTTDQLAAWKNPGDITMIPEARLFYANGIDPSSRFLSKGSYLRVKSILLSYDLPSSILKRIKLERLHIYVRGQNLFTITKYKGWDPEVNSDYQASNINQGVDFYSAPQLKSIVFGVNIGL